MPQQIKWYKKNFVDIDNDNTTITITDATATDNGQDYVDFMRNRKNTSGWRTTGSNDAANTQIDFDLGDSYDIDRILVVGHNLGAFTIQYWDGAAFTDFSTAINETTNTDSTTEFTFNSVSTDQIRVVITGTQTADEDKVIKQFIITESIGQFEGWPKIKKPRSSKNKRRTRLLSGKSLVTKQLGYFSCELEVENWNNSNDLSILETIYFSLDGVLMWLNAGDDTQFARTHIGYRSQDIYLVSPVDEYTPEFFDYYYRTGVKINMKLEEVVR